MQIHPIGARRHDEIALRNDTTRARRIFATAMLFATIGSTVLAQTAPTYAPGSPGANFRDDALLALAETDISRMHRHELDLLTDALGTCAETELNESDSVRRLCNIARARYSVAYYNSRPIDQILFAMSLNAKLLTVRLKSPGDRNAADDISRHINIHFRLSRAVSARNRVLAR